MGTVPYALELETRHDVAEGQHVSLKRPELQHPPTMHRQPKLKGSKKGHCTRVLPKCRK
jgi:hypothetical protein